MNIERIMEGNVLTLILEGRLDANTSQALESEVSNLDGVEKLVFDLQKLEYISSSGLRILLACQKKMNQQGQMVLKNVGDSILEIFDITGFIDFLTIEK